MARLLSSTVTVTSPFRSSTSPGARKLPEDPLADALGETETETEADALVLPDGDALGSALSVSDGIALGESDELPLGEGDASSVAVGVIVLSGGGGAVEAVGCPTVQAVNESNNSNGTRRFMGRPYGGHRPSETPPAGVVRLRNVPDRPGVRVTATEYGRFRPAPP